MGFLVGPRAGLDVVETTGVPVLQTTEPWPHNTQCVTSWAAHVLFPFSLNMNLKIGSMHVFYLHIPKLSVFCVLNLNNYIRNLKHRIKCCSSIVVHCKRIFTARRYVGVGVICWHLHSKFSHTEPSYYSDRPNGQSKIPDRVRFFSSPQRPTGSGSHPAYCAMDTGGSFPGVKAAWPWT
jgi:hypothetical protein